MQKLLFSLLLFCTGLQAAVVTNVQPLSGSKFGLVSTMSVTDLMALEINLVPKGMTLSNYLRILTNNGVASLATTNYVNSKATNGATVAADTGITVTTNATATNVIYSVANAHNTNVLLVGTARGTNLLANTIPFTNVLAAASGIALGTNAGVTFITNTQPFAAVEVQTNGVRVGLITNINWTAGVTGSVSASTAILGVSAAGASVTGTTNVLQLSVQAAKLPATNYVGFENGYQDWETVYYKTNMEGATVSISGSWQFIVPPDYATNSLKVRIYSLLLATNGPNSSNTIFRASVLRATPSDSTDLHTASYGTAVSGTNTWAAAFNGTNKVQSVLINMSTTSALAAGDLCILKVDRDSSNDTFGGATSMVGLQVEYTRP